MEAWIILVHISLAIGATAYALFLNQKHVYEWYSPDRTWVTVIGGDVLIGSAACALCALGVLPWAVIAYFASLHVAAGAPIIDWQLRRALKRQHELNELDRRSDDGATATRRTASTRTD